MNPADPESKGSHAFPCAGRTLRMVLPPHEIEGANRLVQRLCISFVNYATVCSGQRGQIRFPFGWCKLEARNATLHITAGAEDMASLKRVEETVLGRLKRLAHRHRYDLKVSY